MTSSSDGSSSSPGTSASNTTSGATSAVTTSSPTSTGPATTTPGGTTTTTDDAMNYNLQHHDGDCDTILWCTTGMGMNQMGYGPHEFAECFLNVTPTPPFDLLQVRYDVGNFEASMSNVVRLRVYGWDSTNGTPDSLDIIGTQDLASSDVELLGPHTIAVDPPIEVDTDSFCVSIDSDGPFGVTRDETGYIPDLSFQIDQCGSGDWEELEDLGFGGNWCMSATIRG